MEKLISPWMVILGCFAAGFLVGAALPTRKLPEPERTQAILMCVLQMEGTITQCECLTLKAPFKSKEAFIDAMKECK